MKCVITFWRRVVIVCNYAKSNHASCGKEAAWGRRSTGTGDLLLHGGPGLCRPGVPGLQRAPRARVLPPLGMHPHGKEGHVRKEAGGGDRQGDAGLHQPRGHGELPEA